MNMKEIALPNPEYVEGDGIHDEAGLLSNYAPCDLYTADQMRAYALAALASDTGERGEVVAWRWPGGHWQDGGPSSRERDELFRADKEPEYAYSAAPAQPAGGVGSDRMALEMLVAAGFITAEKMYEAVSIAQGYTPDPITPPESGGQGFAMVPRVASMGIRGVLYRTRSGYGDDYMTPEQADALWADLLAAAPAQPDGVGK